MKLLSFCSLSALALLAPTFASADHHEALKSAAFPWRALTAERGYAVVRTIVEGHTLDLESFVVDATKIALEGPLQSSLSYPDRERMIIVKEGLLKATTDGQTDELGPGSVALFLPGEAHQLSQAGNDPVTFYSVFFKTNTPFDLERGIEAGGACLANWDNIHYDSHDRGGFRQNIDRPTANFSRFEMHTTTLNGKLTNHPPHTHRVEEMVVVLKGHVEMLLGEDHVQAKAGDIIFIEANIVHSLVNLGEEPTEYFAIQWHM